MSPAKPINVDVTEETVLRLERRGFLVKHRPHSLDTEVWKRGISTDWEYVGMLWESRTTESHAKRLEALAECLTMMAAAIRERAA